jgi:hypothetical protein
MNKSRWMIACGTALLTLASMTAMAKDHDRDDHGHGHGRGKEHAEYRYRYEDHDRELRGWYAGRHGNLPPGLAKRDELPPGLERQLVERGTLPPGLRKKIRPCPTEFARMLPPPPPDCEHVFIGGRLVLLNRRTFMVLDIFHF